MKNGIGRSQSQSCEEVVERARVKGEACIVAEVSWRSKSRLELDWGWG